MIARRSAAGVYKKTKSPPKSKLSSPRLNEGSMNTSIIESIKEGELDGSWLAKDNIDIKSLEKEGAVLAVSDSIQKQNNPKQLKIMNKLEKVKSEKKNIQTN